MSQAAKKPTLQSVKASSSTTRATRPADLRWGSFRHTRHSYRHARPASGRD